MSLLENIIFAAGTLSYKIKKTLGVYDREPPKEDPLTPKAILISEKEYLNTWGRKRWLGVTAQMNLINYETKEAIDKINAERRKLDIQELKNRKDLTNAKTDADRDLLNKEINSIETRRLELNEEEKKVRANLKEGMDLIRSDFNLPPDCDGSDPHWRV
jgi:hypothetical protein